MPSESSLPGPVTDELVAGHLQELRRGTVVLACLAALRTPGYGYGLLGDLEQAGIDVDGNTLYPLLRRLDRQGLLTSSWQTEEPRPRKLYTTSAAGQELLARLTTEWHALDTSLRALLPTTEPHPRT
jgi:DNA-binding PadR family transcriptional regulator